MAAEGWRGTNLENARDCGFDPDRLWRAFGLLDGWIKDGVLPGAAALVARGGRIVGETYVGLANRTENRPVDSSTIWGLASITKPFTATAVMQLVEHGVLSLDEPAYRYLPDFLDAPETAFNRRHVTLRHLLTHSSGLPGFSEDNFDLRRARQPLSAFVQSFMRQPLFFAPGTAHIYSNPAILMAAEIVARAVSGKLGQSMTAPQIQSFLDHVRSQILEPLGMASSSMSPPDEWNDRRAWVEGTGQEGTDWEMANSAYYRGLSFPWGGLFSTPRDLGRFTDLFLPSAQGRPRVVGRPVVPVEPIQFLSPVTTAAMTAIQFAPPDAPAETARDLRDGSPRTPLLAAVEWGLGWEVKGTKRPNRTGELTSAATFSHAGATGTVVWADPETDVVCVFLTNRTLASGWTTEQPRQAMFSNAVMSALAER